MYETVLVTWNWDSSTTEPGNASRTLVTKFHVKPNHVDFGIHIAQHMI